MKKRFFFRWKKFYGCFAIFSFLMVQHHVIAQVNKGITQDSAFKKYASAINSFIIGHSYYIVEWKDVLPANIHIARQLNANTAIIDLKSKEEFELLKQHFRIADAFDTWKLSPSAERLIKDNNKAQEFILSSLNTDSLLALLQQMKAQLKIVSINSPSHSIIIKTNTVFVKNKLLGLNQVVFVDVHEKPHEEAKIIGYDRGFDGINAVDYLIPGANGKNIVAGVKEQTMDETDLDLYKRVLTSPIASENITSHATVISTIIGGSGNSFYDGRGIAYACRFFSSSFNNLFADDTSVLHANNVTVQNHSYGTAIQQFYGAEAVSYDVHAWLDKNFVHVFSAGNEGTFAANDGQYANIPGFANLTGNFKMAKDIITVGAIDNKGNIPALSSAGPLYDGRLAPQLIALGPNGTSDAAAVVSGTIAVMQQVYADSNNHSLPSASLIKAVLYNTTEDVYNRYIDYKTGYGLLNSYAAIQSIQKKEYDGGILVQGQLWTKTITVPPNAAQLKITLAWTDTAATVNNNKALTNNLDLQVEQMNPGIIYKPWVLNAAPNADSLSQLPIRNSDSLNTAEQVSIQLPAAGIYKVKVIGTSISTATVPFNIAYHADTLNTFVFTSPQHASDINRDEDPSIFIRWKTFVADTNQTGNLYISYDNGTNWQLIKQSLKIFTNQYEWLIKDTNSTGVLKMETSFGDFFSTHFIISKTTRLSVDFLCADSFRLSWNKHVYAKAYRIFTLTDSPYLKNILTVSDTFIVMNHSHYPGLVYAVEPVLNNNLSAMRSIAINIESQGVKCFYKTFYYNLLNKNELELVLELSAVDYVDSLWFEQVAKDGKLLKTYEAIKPNTASIYKQSITQAPLGASYWRVKIKLKSSAVLYTEIISVVTSGKRYIIFYPNPVSTTGLLNYTLQQDLTTGSKLQLFDITGRLLKNYKEMPDNINLHDIAPGVLIYKLFTSDHQLLETGKLVVQ
jgi:hypothetical protein